VVGEYILVVGDVIAENDISLGYILSSGG